MPQLENGYTKIANELIEQFARIRISGEAMQILWVIIRKLYGFKKKSDKIALLQFTKATGMKKPTVCRAIKKLEEMGLITIIKNGNDLASEYRIQKDSDKWNPLSKKIIVIKKDNLPLSILIPSKETITKETIRIKKAKVKKLPQTNETIISDLKIIYHQLDVALEVQKMFGWLSDHPGRKFSKSFAVRWLNKELTAWKKAQPEADNYTVSDAQMEIIMAVENKIYERELASGNNKKGA